MCRRMRALAALSLGNKRGTGCFTRGGLRMGSADELFTVRANLVVDAWDARICQRRQ